MPETDTQPYAFFCDICSHDSHMTDSEPLSGHSWLRRKSDDCNKDDRANEADLSFTEVSIPTNLLLKLFPPGLVRRLCNLAPVEPTSLASLFAFSKPDTQQSCPCKMPLMRSFGPLRAHVSCIWDTVRHLVLAAAVTWKFPEPTTWTKSGVWILHGWFCELGVKPHLAY